MTSLREIIAALQQIERDAGDRGNLDVFVLWRDGEFYREIQRVRFLHDKSHVVVIDCSTK